MASLLFAVVRLVARGGVGVLGMNGLVLRKIIFEPKPWIDCGAVHAVV